MNRSALIALVTGVVLIVGLLVVDHHWLWLAPFSRTEKICVLVFELLGAALVAVSVRRIVDPTLDTPILIVIIGFAIWMVGMFAKARDNDNNDPSNSSTSTSSSSNDKGMGLGWAIFSTIISLGVYGVGVALPFVFAAHPLAGDKPATKPSPMVTAKPVTAEAPPPAPTDIANVADLAAAVAFARPSLTDTRDAPSAGAKLLARYAAAKLRWADVAVKDETSLALVEKDPMAAVGKRLCATGVLARIEKQTIEGTELHTARLVTRKGDAVEMFVVGPTGELVKRSQAKFCGVVAGRLDVGTKPATFAVGMFEIAATKPR